MAKQYELNYYTQNGTSDPMDSLENVQKAIAAQTGMNIAIEDIKEGTMFVTDDGSLMLLSHFEDGFADDDGCHINDDESDATPKAFTYYEIQCYGYGHPQDYAYYLETEKPLLKDEVIQRLKDQFIGVNGLEAHHVDNVVAVIAISRQEFSDGCGVNPSPEPENKNNRSSVSLDITFEIEGSVTPKEVEEITNNILQKYRDDVGFQFNDEDSFVEGIIVTPKQA